MWSSRKYLVLLFPLFSPHFAFSLVSSEITGRNLVTFRTPNADTELCVLPHQGPNFTYSKRDNQIEEQLCRYDLYGLTTSDGQIAVCPKINSTNPGLHLLLDRATLRFPGTPVNCHQRDDNLVLVAKHKQSISCSYTPSILMYYHLSRRFGGILNVPVAVLRTIDKKEHLRWTEQALSYFTDDESELIAQNWRHYKRAHSQPEAYPQIFTTDGKYLYGALVLNLNDEKYYGEVNGKGAYADRENRFQQQRPFLKVASAQPLAEINEGLSLPEKLQNLIQMQDVSNMVLMDYLLNQADRVGNIHYVERQASLENHQLRIQETPFNGSFPVKTMILKDNDCGIIKENRFRSFKILEKVRHMSPYTYHTLLTWADEISQPQTLQFLKKEILLTEKDLFGEDRGLIANAQRAKEILKKNCQSGYLQLDLQPEYLDTPLRFDPRLCE